MRKPFLAVLFPMALFPYIAQMFPAISVAFAPLIKQEYVENFLLFRLDPTITKGVSTRKTKGLLAYTST